MGIFSKKDTIKETASPYPLEELAKHVGEIIEVQHLEQNVLKEEKGILKYPPGRDFFYIGHDVGYHIMHWDSMAGGKMNMIVSIKDKDNHEIYRRSAP